MHISLKTKKEKKQFLHGHGHGHGLTWFALALCLPYVGFCMIPRRDKEYCSAGATKVFKS